MLNGRSYTGSTEPKTPQRRITRPSAVIFFFVPSAFTAFLPGVNQIEYPSGEYVRRSLAVFDTRQSSISQAAHENTREVFMSFPAPVSFNGVQFDIVDRNGTPWLQAGQVSRALGYSQEDAITKVYSRNSDEFTPDMTETVKLGVSGNLQKTVRIFSPRGCHLLGMFASTPKAKEFRRWVLDVLDGKVEAPKQRTAAPVNSTKGQAVAQIILSQTGRFRFSEIQHQLPAAHRRRLPFILYSLMHSGLINRVAHGSYEVVGASPHHQESDTLEAAFMVRSMAKAVDAALSEFRDKIFNMEQTLKLVDSGRMSLVLNARN